MVNFKQIIPLALLWAVNGVGQVTLEVQMKNPSSWERKDVPVVINLAEYGDVKSALIYIDGQEVPCQLDDLDQDGVFDELAFVANIGKKEQKTARVSLLEMGTPREYAPRTYAEMVMRNGKVKEKNKHDIYISSITIDKETANSNSYNVLHHHGVAFESELIAMRI